MYSITRVCNVCKQEKPLTEYYKQGGGRSDYKGTCKQCYNARIRERYQERMSDPDYRAAYNARKREYRRQNSDKVRESARRRREANHEKILQQEREWRARNQEKCREKKKRYLERHRERLREVWRQDMRERRRQNPERIRAIKRQSYQRHKDKVLERNRLWRLKNPEKFRKVVLTYSANRRARKQQAPGFATTAQIRARIEFYGGRCWMCGAPYEHIDHVKPLAAGGSNWPANLRPACSKCNLTKGAEWRGVRALYEWLANREDVA